MRQIIILPGVQTYELARGVHVLYLGADPAREINMDRMNSPYLTGLSSQSPIESLIAAHKIAPFEVQRFKLMKLPPPEHSVFRQTTGQLTNSLQHMPCPIWCQMFLDVRFIESRSLHVIKTTWIGFSRNHLNYSCTCDNCSVHIYRRKHYTFQYTSFLWDLTVFK